jgi:hypothetical protein
MLVAAALPSRVGAFLVMYVFYTRFSYYGSMPESMLVAAARFAGLTRVNAFLVKKAVLHNKVFLLRVHA